jgi:hypothetical protein
MTDVSTLGKSIYNHPFSVIVAVFVFVIYLNKASKLFESLKIKKKKPLFAFDILFDLTACSLVFLLSLDFFIFWLSKYFGIKFVLLPFSYNLKFLTYLITVGIDVRNFYYVSIAEQTRQAWKDQQNSNKKS